MKALAVDVGGTHISCGAVDGKCLLARSNIETNSRCLLADLLPILAEQINRFQQEHTGTFAGIGFGFCGLVDKRAGRIVSTNLKYPDATSIDLIAWAQQEFGLPLVLENDARMALLGERHSGAAQHHEDVVMMTLGTGIGTAVMMGGEIVRGKHHQAGCLGGHFTVSPGGRLCSCGGRGCFEAEASTYALPDICRNWPGFDGSRLNAEEVLDFRVLFSQADGGDAVADQIREYCVSIWSACALSLVHAYDPDVLIVGGGVTKSFFPLLAAIQKHLDINAWTPWGRVTVIPAVLGDDAALLGAALLLESQR